MAGELLTVRRCAVGDRRDARSPRAQVAGGELAHPPGAHEEHTSPREVVEDLLRKGCGGGRHRGGCLPDGRLDPCASPGVQRHPEQPVEEGAGRADVVRVANLPEDLALAGHERVQARCDTEEVERGRLVAQPVQHRLERGSLLLGELEQRRDGTFLQGCRLTRREVELRAVAGGEDDALAAEGERGREGARAVEVDGDALPELYRGLVVRDANECELHGASAPTRRSG